MLVCQHPGQIQWSSSNSIYGRAAGPELGTRWCCCEAARPTLGGRLRYGEGLPSKRGPLPMSAGLLNEDR